MMKKVLGVLTAAVTALAVVGVAWASSGDDTPTSVTAATGTSVASTSGSPPATSAPTTSQASTSSSQASTSSSQASTSTSIAGTTSTSTGGSTSTSTGATTSSSLDDDRNVPDSITTHVIPAVGSVTVQVSSGNLILVSVDAPGWTVDRDKIERDRIRLRFTSGEAEGEFEARLENGRVEVRIEVKSD